MTLEQARILMLEAEASLQTVQREKTSSDDEQNGAYERWALTREVVEELYAVEWRAAGDKNLRYMCA